MIFAESFVDAEIVIPVAVHISIYAAHHEFRVTVE